MSSNYGFLGRERLFNGPWSAFERAIARLLVHKGWKHVAIIGGSGDNGGDIICANEDAEAVYQVKFRTNGGSVGIEIVNDIKRAMEYYGISRGCVVTNGYLSKSANNYINNLRKSGYKIAKLEGKDLLEIFCGLDNYPNVKLDIREYQALALESILSPFDKGNRSALLVLATGLGKTFVAGKFLREVFKRYKTFKVLVLANKDDLIKQFEIALWTHLDKNVATHLWDGFEKPINYEGVTLATFQSVLNHIRTSKPLPDFNIVIIDESHHAGAATYQEVINYLEPDFLLGMTATPFRTDDFDIKGIFGNPTFSMDIIEGMRHGFLAKVDYKILADNINWDFISRNSKKAMTIKDLNKKLFIPKRDEEIVKQLKATWEMEGTNRCIVFCASVEHIKTFEKTLLSYGFRARGLYYGMNPRERERYLREFRQGKINVLLAVDILNEGIDIPEVDLVVFLRVTHSRIIFLQQLGRGLRLSRGKKKVIVLDFVADIKRVASLMNLYNRSKEYVPGDIEVLGLKNFEVKFSDATSESLLEAIINDRFEIEDFDDTSELFIPKVGQHVAQNL